MIGPKKLSTIREELQTALAATGEDPIRWLEMRIAASESQGPRSSGETDVLKSLLRFLKDGTRRKPRQGRARTHK
jgi:hypothetical protein